MAIWREAVFGPVLAVRRVRGIPGGGGAVNDSVYGLFAALLIRDVGLAHRFCELAEVGQVSVNLPMSGWHGSRGGGHRTGAALRAQ
jgi:aldehyde dehydrogenase (NAD+)